MINKLERLGKWPWLNFKVLVLSQHLPERSEGKIRNPSQDNQSPRQNVNSEPQDYKAGWKHIHIIAM
jgi:hypothetical protein